MFKKFLTVLALHLATGYITILRAPIFSIVYVPLIAILIGAYAYTLFSSGR